MHARIHWVLTQFSYLRQQKAFALLTVLFLIFVGLALLVRTPGLEHLDLQFTLALQRYRSPLLDAVAEGFTFAGNGATLTVVGTAAIVGFWLARRRWTALFCGVSLIGHPLDYLLKYLVERPRPVAPLVQVIVRATGLSYPSGHALASLLFYGFLAFLAWIYFPRRPPRLFWTTFFAILTFGIGLSRIYLGDHWFSDVIGGWASGAFVLLILGHLYVRVARAEIPTQTEAVSVEIEERAPTRLPTVAPKEGHLP